MIGHGLRTAVFALVVVLFAGLAYERNNTWYTLLSLWQDTAEKSPGKSRVLNNLGNCYILEGMHFKAIEAYQRAVALDSSNIEAYYNLGTSYENVGIMNRAVYYYNWFCKAAPASYGEQREQACNRVGELTGSGK
jgi:tetratricopeptide (TPR) repeat protein